MSLILDANQIKEKDKYKAEVNLAEQLFNSINLPDSEKDSLKEDFEKWLKDESYFSKYDNVTLTRDGSILIRVYRYEKDSKVLGSRYLKILPVAKVIKVNSNSIINGKANRFKPGDILSLPENIKDIRVTEAWIMWKLKMEREKPTPNIPEPEKLDGLLISWNPNKFTLDKLNITDDDNYTFIKSETDFNIKYEN